MTITASMPAEIPDDLAMALPRVSAENVLRLSQERDGLRRQIACLQAELRDMKIREENRKPRGIDNPIRPRVIYRYDGKWS